jgi:nucleoside-diphosphate-sugar epimerase
VTTHLKILVTGASGFIGQHLVEQLTANHSVVSLSRNKATEQAVFVKGAFDRFEDLRLLDAYTFNLVVHLAAVTGGCSEEDGLAVNVQGTRRLYRYLLDRGCRKFITASSIAAVGCLDGDFLPEELPIPDLHPCLAKDAYGFSKAMVEELTFYLHRTQPDTDFINLRFGAVLSDETWIPAAINSADSLPFPFVQLGQVFASDVVNAIIQIVEAPIKHGVRTCNLVGPDSNCSVSTLDMLHSILGEKITQYDLSYYEQPGHANKPLYAMDRIYSEFGFKSVKSTRP